MEGDWERRGLYAGTKFCGNKQYTKGAGRKPRRASLFVGDAGVASKTTWESQKRGNGGGAVQMFSGHMATGVGGRPGQLHV